MKYLWLSIAAGLAVAPAGFYYLGRYPLRNAFHVSITAITAVGSGKIHSFSQRGGFLDCFLIFFGVGLMFPAVTMAKILFERGFGQPTGLRNCKQMIEKPKDHCIVCGFGRAGRGAAHKRQMGALA